MRKLNVHIEKSGNMAYVGAILGDGPQDACFTYAREYISDPDSAALSINLPLQAEAFSPQQTRNYFEGLLPEGFTRRSVAQLMQADEGDYLTILAGLGAECIGAVQVTEHETDPVNPSYEKLSLERVRELAREGASNSAQLAVKAHLSLAGASGKVGLYYDPSSGDWFLPHGTAPSTHIVKQSHVRLSGIVANEQLVMRTAAKLGLDVAETFILNTGGSGDGDVLFATSRYDRLIHRNGETVDGLARPLRLHQEDMAQALGIASSEKYERRGQQHLIRMFALLRSFSADPVRDQLKLWDAVVFAWLAGNTDAHCKNFSLLYSSDLHSVRLAPLYDIVSTAVYPESTREMAFSIGGKYLLDEIGHDEFRSAAKDAGLGERLAMSRFDALRQGFKPALTEAAEELLRQGYRQVEDLQEKILKFGGIAEL